MTIGAAIIAITIAYQGMMRGGVQKIFWDDPLPITPVEPPSTEQIYDMLFYSGDASFKHFDPCQIKVIDRFGKALAESARLFGIGHHVDIVEAVERQVEFLDESQRRLALAARGFAELGDLRHGPIVVQVAVRHEHFSSVHQRLPELAIVADVALAVTGENCQRQAISSPTGRAQSPNCARHCRSLGPAR